MPATVPTKTELDALAAKVTALEARIKKLETTPVPVPVPDLSTYSDLY